mgnify:CR=1 FL=1
MSKSTDHDKHEKNESLFQKVKEKSAGITHEDNNYYVAPQEFQSKSPKKSNQTLSLIHI